MRLNTAYSGLKVFAGINRKRFLAVCALVLAMVAGLLAQTAQQAGSHPAPRANRITQELRGAGAVTMAGSVPPRTRQATDLGEVDSSLPMESLTLNIGLSAAQQTELNALTEAQQDPKSPQYHQWLTQEEFGARFGLTDADLSKVTGWLTGQGFTVKSVASSRNLITFSGTVSEVETAFHTQIHQYALNGAKHISNATEIALPSALSGVVTHVGGLNSFRPKPHSIVKRSSPQFTSMFSGSHFLTPGDWATIYNVNPIYTSGQTGTTGTGMHVGIVGQTFFPTTDIDNFRAAAGLSATKLNMVCISTVIPTHCTDVTGETVVDIGEADLDVEWAGGIAKDATVDYIYASAADKNQGVFEALFYAITTYRIGPGGAVVPVLSMSYGDCETDLGSGYTTSVDHFFQQAAAQGQTILNSSGDAGGAGCDQGGTISTKGAVADWPASNPNVTSVGGTTFSGDGSDKFADAFWSGDISGDVISSALQYIPETSWNDTAARQKLHPTATLASSGGGVSVLYGLPSWQWFPSNYGDTAMRFVPDVAFAASPDHDGYLVCTQDFPPGAKTPSTVGSTCINGFRLPSSDPLASPTLTVFGGTSAGSPAFAGMLTLLVQKYGNLGNINPKLYSLASNATSYAAAFHDITTGDGKQPCSTGAGCSGGSVGNSATTGYDLVTGLGSINGGGLYAALGSTSSQTTTTTTLTVTPTSLTSGGTVTLTASVAPTSGAMTGTATIRVGDTILGTPPISGGTATLSNVTVSAATGFSAGSQSITASYGGDGNFAASSGSTTLAVVPTYTLVPAASSATIGRGSSGTVVLNLTSLNYAGTVSFTTSVSSPNVTASATAVTLTSGGSGTATLTISPSSKAGTHTPLAPWKRGGAVVFCAVLLGAPFRVRRRRAAAVLLIAAAMALAGLLMACGGGSKAARSYTVTVTPTGTGAVTNPAAVSITVSVP